MADVAAAKDAIRDAGAEIAFVHGGTVEEAAPWFEKFGLGDVVTISDPGLAHYRAFGLGRTTIGSISASAVPSMNAACAARWRRKAMASA